MINLPKLRSSVSIVQLQDGTLEFFLSNTRRHVRIKTNGPLINNIISDLDGTLNVFQIAQKYNLDEDGFTLLNNLLSYLLKKSIICDAAQNTKIFLKDKEKFRRILNFLEDYADSSDTLEEMWFNISNSTVVIIGLGGVGSWVAMLMVESGVRNLILIDDDTVELSNLHRQYGYFESDVGEKKIIVLKRRLMGISSSINVQTIEKKLDPNMLEETINSHVDLIINCADKPNVDTTSMWVGGYCMKRRIPHIIGGGYNLHLSLIGQTVIPFESACVKCFEKSLAKINSIDENRLKKMEVKNRKIGSFGPMCTIIASMIGMEAIKVLSKKISPSNKNRRGEFDIYSMKVQYRYINKDPECEWCGEKNEDYKIN